MLSYVGLYFTGVLFLLFEKDDEFVRKSAAQSLVLSIASVIFRNLSLVIPFVGKYIAIIFDVLFIILLVFLVVKASKYIYFKLPIISDISEKYVLHWFE